MRRARYDYVASTSRIKGRDKISENQLPHGAAKVRESTKSD